MLALREDQLLVRVALVRIGIESEQVERVGEHGGAGWGLVCGVAKQLRGAATSMSRSRAESHITRSGAGQMTGDK